MPTSSSTDTVTPNKYSIFFLLSLIVLGLAGNYFKFPIFLNIDFLFGSIFAMLALQFFGISRGILAAAMISSYTYILWNHPYAIIIMTAEVAVVGWLMGRRKMGMVLADTLYWLLIGLPLVYLSHSIVMHIPASNTCIVMTKQAVNGIANALFARLIFTGYALRLRSSLTSYHEIIYNLLTFFVLCPALILLAIGSRTDFAEIDHNIRTTLIQESQHVTDKMETWMVNRRSVIVNLAEMAVLRTPQQMQPPLEQAMKSDINFQGIGLMDREATTSAFYPLVDELGQNNIGKNFADRSYIPILKQTLKPLLSEVIMSRIGVPKPLVAMLAPVVINGEYSGYVAGALSLKQIEGHFDKSTNVNATLYTLLDKNGNVIMTNRTDQMIMTPFVRGKGVFNHLDEGISQWVPVVLSNTSISERWGKSFYVAESAIGDLAEWKLILEQPIAPFQKRLYNNYTGKLILLLLILLGALALAELLSRRIFVTLEKLQHITHDLPVKMITGGKEISWPESGIKEAIHLINNFKAMGDLLSKKFNEVRKINESLEQRTQELQESEKRFRTVADHTYAWEAWESPEGSCLYSSPSCERITGYSPEAFRADSGLLERLIHPDDLPRWMAHYAAVHNKPGTQEAVTGSTSELELRLLHSDGTVHWINHFCRHIYDAEGRDLGLRISNRDITEQKKTDEKIKILAGLIDIAPASITVHDLDGNHLYANQTAFDLHGYSKEEFLALNVLEIDIPESEQLFASRVQQLMENKTISFTVGHYRKDRTIIPLMVFARLAEWGEKKVILSIASDITEHKRLEAEALRAKNLESLGILAGGIAHDFNNLLQALIGNLELAMINIEQSSKAIPFLEKAEQVSGVASQLTKQLIAFSPGGNSLPIIIQPASHIREEATSTLSDSDLVAEFDLANNLWSITIDPSQFCNVIKHMVLNAMEAMPSESGGHIKIMAANESLPENHGKHPTLAPGNYVGISIQDQGCGISNERLSRIFDPYFSTKERGSQKGMGLGLALCDAIIRKNGGAITVQSKLGKGTTFHIYLPAVVG